MHQIYFPALKCNNGFFVHNFSEPINQNNNYTAGMAKSKSIARCSILGLFSLRKQQIGKLQRHMRCFDMSMEREG